MVTHSHLVKVARELKRRVGRRGAFLTIVRGDITELIREVSGEDTRMKHVMGAGLEQALLEQGIRCLPSLDGTSTDANILLFHAGTVLSRLVDMLIHPSTDNDTELGDILKKIKGTWHWPEEAPEAA